MRLPTTSYILLGMLSSQELSGYDLKLLLDKHIHHIYWSPAKSQIYGELRRLEREGLATMTEVPQTSRPDKRLYRITPAGLTALQEWLASPDAEPDAFKSPLLLHLFFGRLVPYQVLITQLEAHEHKLRTELAGYETQARALQDQAQALTADVPLPLYLLTLRFQMSMIQAALTWTAEAVAQLQGLQDTTR